METRFEIKENGNMTDIVLSIETLNTRDTNEKETYKNLVGVVSTSKEFGPVEYGLGLTVDMSYHEKQDTHTETFVQLTPFMEVDTFEEICQNNGINIVYEKAKKF